MYTESSVVFSSTAKTGPTMGTFRPRRRWLSYSLRTLFIATAVLAIILARWVNGAREQRVALATIEKNNPRNRFQYDYEYAEMRKGIETWTEPPTWVPQLVRDSLGKDYFYNVESVVLGYKRTSQEDRATWRAVAGLWNLQQLTSYIEAVDDDLVHLAGLRQLKYLDLNMDSPRLTDNALRTLSRLPKLERISLPGGQFTPEGFRSLARMRNLTHLGLLPLMLAHAPPHSVEGLVACLGAECAADVTGAGLADIAQLANLEVLSFASNKVTDAGLAQLASLAHLKKLEIGSEAITGSGFERLAGLQHLEDMKLYCPNLSDDALRFLGRLPKLRYVELHKPAINGSGFEHFPPDTQIESLFVDGPNFNDEAVAAPRTLQQAL